MRGKTTRGIGIAAAGLALAFVAGCAGGGSSPPSASKADAEVDQSSPPCMGNADGECADGNPMNDF